MTDDELPTPCFLISESALLANLACMERLRRQAGVRMLLALKCFSCWGAFPVLAPYLDGTTSSGPYEARLGRETLGKETHAYSVAYADWDIPWINACADKAIFNSLGQLARYRAMLKPAISVGLRINPGVSYARQDLADPARRHSRLGVPWEQLRQGAPDADLRRLGVDGAMLHMNCENADIHAYADMLDLVSGRLGHVLDRLSWLSLGGGVAFTAPGYPVDSLARLLREFAHRHRLVLYMEPGEAVVTRSTDLIVTVLDIVRNGMDIAVVDSATEAHRLDTLVYREPATIRQASANGVHAYQIAASSCLAGDVFCTARFDAPLQVGQRLHVQDSGGYTMVKLNWFNGLRMPAVYFRHLDGRLTLLNRFDYADFKRAMSLHAIACDGQAEAQLQLEFPIE